MAFLQWTKDLDTGINVIDSQHKRIVDYINELDAVNVTRNRGEINRVLDELVDYTVTHFAFEESLQEKAEYPFIKAHRRVHEIFTKKVVEFQNRAKAGENVAPEILSMLKTWLVNHIKGDDADYVESVKRSLGDQKHAEQSGWLGSALKKFFR
ncbi:MAG: bacteriohemerythrin [Nitrosomonadales bacterium]|nr:bacteriohemerythrin [Nitrosomonadales bacterium]